MRSSSGSRGASLPPPMPGAIGPPAGDWLSGRFRLDSALFTAYLACTAIVLVLLPLSDVRSWPEAGAGLGLQLAVGIMLACSRRLRGREITLAGPIGVIIYLVSVALLRDGAGSTAGYGSLALLPVLWASLRGGLRELSLAVFGVAAVYIGPVLLVGLPQYPAAGWRSGLLMAVLSGAIGLTVRGLVGRVGTLLSHLEAVARSDELTGLPNRRAWTEMLDHELASARRSGQPLAVALIDLDGFKQFNDTHGHLAGDELLRTAAIAWRGVLRDTDTLARWGGDEFGLLLPRCDVTEGQALLERLRAAGPGVPFSAGLVGWDHEIGPDEILAEADRALYDAKLAGRQAVTAGC